jgi:predicted ester cyclase
MTSTELESRYRDYIACLNRRDWDALPRFVHRDVRHGGKTLGVAGYRAMLEKDCEQIPDLRFHIELLVVDPPRLAARLHFDVTPATDYLGLPVQGRRVSFHENVFYAYRDGLIEQVWSVIDKRAIESQLGLS